MSPISLLIVDENEIFLDLLANFSSDLAPQIVETEILAHYDESVHRARSLRPNFIVHDLGLPSLRGLPSIRRLRRAMPNVGIIALTLLNSARLISKAIGAGADEVIYKGSIFWDLAPAIDRVFAARNRDNCATDSAFKRRSRQPAPIDPFENLRMVFEANQLDSRAN